MSNADDADDAVRADDADDAVMAAALALQPLIVAEADDIERTGRLPDRLATPMAQAGLFQLYLPSQVGGPEVHPLTALSVCEALAIADGSVAWCASVSSALSTYLAWLPPDELARIAGPKPTLRLSGSARPLGHARPVEGGYIVNGRWDFASNVNQADFYMGTCVVHDGTRSAGQPVKTRAVAIPPSQGVILDTWHTLGMRGTGSHDFEVTELFVPTARIASFRYGLALKGRVFHPRLQRVVIWSPTAGVALGLARGALNAFRDVAAGRSASNPVALRDRAEIQLVAGRAEAAVGSARAYCFSAIEAAWQAVGETDIEPGDLDAALANARLAITHAMNVAAEVTAMLQRAAGTSGVYNRAGMERRFRDAHVANQHAAGLDLHLQTAGSVLLGVESGEPYF